MFSLVTEIKRMASRISTVEKPPHILI